VGVVAGDDDVVVVVGQVKPNRRPLLWATVWEVRRLLVVEGGSLMTELKEEVEDDCSPC